MTRRELSASDIESCLMATSVYRKGAVHTVTQRGGLEVHDIHGYPHVKEIPQDAPRIDLHFVQVAVDPDLAEHVRGNLIQWLKTYPEPERLAGGPSYIEFAASAGIEQETAFRIFALGEVLNLWRVMIPASVGVTGSQADELAGNGFVLISGWRDAA